MAKIKFGSIITDSRGSIGGHSLKWSRWGNVLLTKPTPRHATTARKSLVNSVFGGQSKIWWSELTPTQRTAWRALAAANPRPDRWGDDYPLTGLALFLSLNMRLFRAGELGLLDAPADQTVTSPVTAALTVAAAGTYSLAFTASPVPTDHVAYLSATPAQSPGKLNLAGKFAWLSQSASSQTSPWSLLSEYTSRFGALTTGRQYAVELRFLNTTNGALSPPIQTATIAT